MDTGPIALQVAPGSSHNVYRHHSGICCRADVIVNAISNVDDLSGVAGCFSRYFFKERKVRLFDSPTTGSRNEVCRQVHHPNCIFLRYWLVAGNSYEITALSEAFKARSHIWIKILSHKLV